MISHDELRRLLHYNPATGEFTWLIDPAMGPKRAGKRAGYYHSSLGRNRIKIGGKPHFASRVAWFYVTGEWPADFVDHINLDKADDRFENLRLATRSQNGANRKVQARSKWGFKGVSQESRTGKFIATARKNGVTHYAGLHETPEAAHAAYLAKAQELHGEFARG